MGVGVAAARDLGVVDREPLLCCVGYGMHAAGVNGGWGGGRWGE